MTDAQALALLLGVLYLIECVVRVPTGGLVLRPGGPSAGIARPPEWSDVARGGFVLDDPLPPFRGHAVLQPWTIALDAHGVLSHLGGRGAEGAEALRFVRWQDVGLVHTVGREIWVGGAPLRGLASPAAALAVAGLLDAIANAPPERREAIIADAVARRLDPAAVTARHATARSPLLRSRISAHIVFCLAVALVLALLDVPPFHAVWLAFVAALPIAMVWCVRDFALAQRRLCPDAPRTGAIVAMSLSPLAAIRAPAAAGRALFAEHDPLAVAAALCDAPRFAEHAGRALRDLRHPPPPACPSADAAAVRCEAFFRGLLADRAEALVRSQGLDPAALLGPPQCAAPTNRTWCPRCHAQYELAEGSCADCAGLALVAFEGSSKDRSTRGVHQPHPDGDR